MLNKIIALLRSKKINRQKQQALKCRLNVALSQNCDPLLILTNKPKEQGKLMSRHTNT